MIVFRPDLVYGDDRPTRQQDIKTFLILGLLSSPCFPLNLFSRLFSLRPYFFAAGRATFGAGPTYLLEMFPLSSAENKTLSTANTGKLLSGMNWIPFFFVQTSHNNSPLRSSVEILSQKKYSVKKRSEVCAEINKA